nr:hypothetical protein [Antarctobacter heliothermus]
MHHPHIRGVTMAGVEVTRMASVGEQMRKDRLIVPRDADLPAMCQSACNFGSVAHLVQLSCQNAISRRA